MLWNVASARGMECNISLGYGVWHQSKLWSVAPVHCVESSVHVWCAGPVHVWAVAPVHAMECSIDPWYGM